MESKELSTQLNPKIKLRSETLRGLACIFGLPKIMTDRPYGELMFLLD